SGRGVGVSQSDQALSQRDSHGEKLLGDHPRLQGPVPGNQREERLSSETIGVLATPDALGARWFQQGAGSALVEGKAEVPSTHRAAPRKFGRSDTLGFPLAFDVASAVPNCPSTPFIIGIDSTCRRLIPDSEPRLAGQRRLTPEH